MSVQVVFPDKALGFIFTILYGTFLFPGQSLMNSLFVLVCIEFPVKVLVASRLITLVNTGTLGFLLTSASDNGFVDDRETTGAGFTGSTEFPVSSFLKNGCCHRSCWL